MDFRLLVAFCMTTLALGAGCRQNNAHRELLERELRFQEDRIYQLEGELEQTRRELSHYCETTPGISTVLPETHSAASPRTNDLPLNNEFAPAVDLPATITSRKEAAPPFTVPPVILPPDPNVPEGLPSRGVTPGASSSPTMPSLPTMPPAVELPREPVLKPMSSPKFLSPSQRLRVPVENGAAAAPPEPVPQGFPSAADANANSPAGSPSAPSNERVTALAFGKRTGGLNLDGRPGDDGILVVLEPRTARGEITAGSGDVAIVLLDPAASGEGARYARWEFTGTDFAALFRPASSEGPAGTYLELSWPDAPPQHSRLKLFVRMRTPDGRQLQIDRDISVSLPVGTTTIAPPLPFAPTLAPPQVLPVGAPTPDEHDRNAPPTLNWGKRSEVQPAVLVPDSQTPPLPAQPSNSIYEPTPIEGPSLGPMLLPSWPR